MNFPPPDVSFQGRLLSYQQKGVDWLQFLYRWGFSALLADEMGLGKTVQVLAFFSRLKTNLPILIVAPTSLLYNWLSEIRRFLPSFSVSIHSGASRDLQGLKNERVIITSYSVLRLDEALFSQMEFEAVVLDESNAIKTSTTQTARAAYSLKSRFKVALSGTPIENRSLELWSQFHFLMPDLLGERSFFQTTDLEMVRRKISPFILRRRKEEVQLDLPEKIEQVVWIEMSSEQKEVYDSYHQGLRGGLLQKIQEEGASAHRMEILEAILRLRQICADPRLVGAPHPGAKLEQLLSDIEEAMKENRKVLVYSQFTSMLQLISKALREKGLFFLYLDGSMHAEEREKAVKQFQEDPFASLFLLSLKAGGVGLNLTNADTVFLFDPWWNEAVESQAIDRAHRIGQKKTVFAKRYLTPGTIEEKMLELKSNKLKLIDQFLENHSSLSSEDLIGLLDFP